MTEIGAEEYIKEEVESNDDFLGIIPSTNFSTKMKQNSIFQWLKRKEKWEIKKAH